MMQRLQDIILVQSGRTVPAHKPQFPAHSDPYLAFSNFSIRTHTLFPGCFFCSEARGLGLGGGVGRGRRGAGGIRTGCLSCPRASKCTGLGGTELNERERRRRQEGERHRRSQAHFVTTATVHISCLRPREEASISLTPTN